MKKNSAIGPLFRSTNPLTTIIRREAKTGFIATCVLAGTSAFVVLAPTGCMSWPVSRYTVAIVLAVLVLPRVHHKFKSSDSSLLLLATQAFREGYHAAWSILTVFIIDRQASSSDTDC